MISKPKLTFYFDLHSPYAYLAYQFMRVIEIKTRATQQMLTSEPEFYGVQILRDLLCTGAFSRDGQSRHCGTPMECTK